MPNFMGPSKETHSALRMRNEYLSYPGSANHRHHQPNNAHWRFGKEKQEEKHERNEKHPHIRAAIHELEEAKRELQRADHDFGGHRVEAIESIDNAIKQLRQALQFDKK